MPLRARDLIALAETGQQTIAIVRQQGQEALRLTAVARQGELSLEDLLTALEELFLGQDLILQPLEQPFERTLWHYNALRLRINDNSARRMAKRRKAMRKAKEPGLFDNQGEEQ